LTLFEKILMWVRSVWALKTPIPNQDIVEEPGKAMGLSDEDNEPLQASEKIQARDQPRWELDPAASRRFWRTNDA
jgi:Family of unknown function (DUF6335)